MHFADQPKFCYPCEVKNAVTDMTLHSRETPPKADPVKHFINWSYPSESPSAEDVLRLLAVQFATFHIEGVERFPIIPFQYERATERGELRGLCWKVSDLAEPPQRKIDRLDKYRPIHPDVKAALKSAFEAMTTRQDFGSAVVLSPDFAGYEDSGRHYAYLYVDRPPKHITGLAIEFRGDHTELRNFGDQLCKLLDPGTTFSWGSFAIPFISAKRALTSTEIVRAAREAMTRATLNKEGDYISRLERHSEDPSKLLTVLYERALKIYNAVAQIHNKYPPEQRAGFRLELAKKGAEIAKLVLSSKT